MRVWVFFGGKHRRPGQSGRTQDRVLVRARRLKERGVLLDVLPLSVEEPESVVVT